MSSRVGTDKWQLSNLFDEDVFFVLYSKTSGPDNGSKDAEEPFEEKALHEEGNFAIDEIEDGGSLRVPMDVKFI